MGVRSGGFQVLRGICAGPLGLPKNTMGPCFPDLTVGLFLAGPLGLTLRLRLRVKRIRVVKWLRKLGRGVNAGLHHAERDGYFVMAWGLGREA